MSGAAMSDDLGRPDPTTVQTLADLAHAFQLLRGNRSYSELDKAINPGHGKAPRMLPSSTLSNLFQGKSVPTRETLIRFLTACGLDDHEQIPWLTAWERAGTDGPRAPKSPSRARLGRPIGEVDPLVLEVHRAIEVGGMDQPLLPSYVSRAHDARLDEVVSAVVAGASRLAVLVGGSSTGKTRTCWEAVKRLPERWRLWHPYDPSPVQAAIDALVEVTPYTVVWLNEAQRYLLPTDPVLGERVAAGLRTLLADTARSPVLVLATMWPEYWATLTASPISGQPDTHAQARELLVGRDIRVPETFTPVDLRGLYGAAAEDSRLRHAADHAADGRVTQHLAGVPELVARYCNAQPAARAILDAVIDVRRFGHPPAIPHALLELAAPGYMTNHEWQQAGEDWLEQALAYTAQPCHGVPGPLARIRFRPDDRPMLGEQSFYRLADYLEQTGRTERAGIFPPSTFWNAATTTITDSNLLRQLGELAQERGRYQHAIHLYQRAADLGDLFSLQYLATLRDQAGDSVGAEALVIRAADRGDTSALMSLASDRELAGDTDGAEVLYQQAADRGNTEALDALAWLRAEVLVEPDELVELRAPANDPAGDEARAIQAAEQGDNSPLTSLAWQREQTGDMAGADTLYQQAADRGDSFALRRLADLRERTGDLASAEALTIRAAHQDNISPLGELAELRERAGDRAGAEALAIQAEEQGNPFLMGSLAGLRERAGDPAGAEVLYWRSAEGGNIFAWRQLARLHDQAGDSDGAEALAIKAVDQGDTSALDGLALLRKQAGDLAGAEILCRHAVDRGAPFAVRALAKLLEQTGDRDSADQLQRFGLNADGTLGNSLDFGPVHPTHDRPE